MSGRTAEKATLEEFYQAFSLALREELMINFISMKYLPSSQLTNLIIKEKS